MSSAKTREASQSAEDRVVLRLAARVSGKRRAKIFAVVEKAYPGARLVDPDAIEIAVPPGDGAHVWLFMLCKDIVGIEGSRVSEMGNSPRRKENAEMGSLTTDH